MPFKNISYILLAFILSTCSFKSYSQSTPDPGVPGPFLVSKEFYDLGDLAYRSVAEFKGSIHYPSSLTGGPFPLIVFLHGNHATSYRISDSSCGFHWPTSTGYETIPNFEGYDYFAENLASQGFIVVSISGNGANVVGDPVFRGDLIEAHLNFWNGINISGGGGFGFKFMGKIDMSRIGAMGHSRGGEGLATFALSNESKGRPYQLNAILLLAPAYGPRQISNIPMMVVMPYCDGDLKYLGGFAYYDDARYPFSSSRPSDFAPKYCAVMMGANHNFFNTKWTPKSFFACATDDAEFLLDSFCSSGIAGNGRFDSLQQRKALVAYGAAFYKEHLLNDTSHAPILEVKDIFPPSSTGLDTNDVFMSFHAGIDKRKDINRSEMISNLDTNNLLGEVKHSALKEYTFYGPYGRYNGGMATTIVWENDTDYYENEIPDSSKDISNFDGLIFRACYINLTVDKDTEPLNFTVQIIDSLGNVGSQTIRDKSKAIFNTIDNGKPILNSIRLPLNEFYGVDPTKIKSVRFLFNKTKNAGITFNDIAFVSSKKQCVTEAIFWTGFIGYTAYFGNASFFNPKDSIVYSWEFGDPISGPDNTSTLFNPNHIYSDSGFYNVCLFIKSYGKNGFVCSDSVCETIYVEYDPTLSHNGLSTKSKLKVYPNPASNYIIIKGTQKGDFIELFNILGQSVYKTSIQDEIIILPQNLNNGLYSFVITNKTGRHFEKIYIQ